MVIVAVSCPETPKSASFTAEVEKEWSIRV